MWQKLWVEGSPGVRAIGVGIVLTVLGQAPTMIAMATVEGDARPLWATLTWYILFCPGVAAVFFGLGWEARGKYGQE
jgi:hypothetical protein